MLLARGILIKKIIDDDVFCYSAIRDCKNYMLEHQKVDACISNSLTISFGNTDKVSEHTRFNFFKDWKEGTTKSFTFSDVYLMLRKNSLAYIGLYDTKFRMLDWEYSLRISYLKANIVYYTGYMAMGVDTPGNVTSETAKDTLIREGNIGKLLYEYAGDGSDISTWSKIKIAIGKFLQAHMKANKVERPLFNLNILQDFYSSFYGIINKKNEESKREFY